MQAHTRRLGSGALGLFLLFATTAPVFAAEGQLIANVNRVLISGDSRWGGCMALLSVDPQTVLPGCQSWWLSFSCSGDFADPLRAYRMLDAAELALATGKQVHVFFQDDKTHNTYCFANRIDVIR